MEFIFYWISSFNTGDIDMKNLRDAFLLGQDFAREIGDPLVQKETRQLFHDKFGDDVEAKAEFDKGFSHEKDNLDAAWSLAN